MDVSLILKIAGVGLLVAISTQILGKTGRDDHSTYVSLAGIIVILLMLIGEIGDLFSMVFELFDF